MRGVSFAALLQDRMTTAATRVAGIPKYRILDLVGDRVEAPLQWPPRLAAYQ